ncbi:MAG TPA: hypothetical protein VGA06_01100, partial [Candidatus Paceibacterota bacterium]
MDNMLSGLSGNQRLLVIGIAGFVIGVALTTLFFVAGGMGATVVVEQNPIVAEEDDDRGVGDGSARVGNAISRGNDRVSADDQPAGSIVKLASVSLATSSWVAIHEDVAGNPGNILGAV